MMFDPNINVLQIAAATIALMVVGTVTRFASMRRTPPEIAKVRVASLKSWWLVVLATLGAAILGRRFAVALFIVTSAVALREYFEMRRNAIGVRQLILVSYGLIPLSYLWIALDLSFGFILFLPLGALLALGSCMLLWAPVEGYASTIGQTYWGLVLTAYAPAYAALLFTLPSEGNPVAGAAGWFLFLMLLNQFDDISQALIGRAIGKRRIAPVVSPHKTWAGFIGGVLLTTMLGAVLAPWLTPWRPAIGAIAGLLISLTGFLGDLNISGIKRDCGVKDSGNLLPGQGGILDRIDSLIFAAPAFYSFVIFMDASSRGSTP